MRFASFAVLFASFVAGFLFFYAYASVADSIRPLSDLRAFACVCASAGLCVLAYAVTVIIRARSYRNGATDNGRYISRVHLEF